MSNEEDKFDKKEFIKEVLDEFKKHEFNQAKVEYKEITSFHEKIFNKFLWAGGIITVVVSIFNGCFFYKSFDELQKNMNERAEKIVGKATTAQSKSDSILVSLKKDADDALKRNELNYNTQIQILKEDVRNLALSSARNRIDEVLTSSKIQNLVDERVREEVGKKLGLMVENEVTAKSTEIMDLTTKMTIAYNRISYRNNGSRSDLNYLENLSNNHLNEDIRNSAKEMILQQGREYDSLFVKVQESFVRGFSILNYKDDTQDTSKITLIAKLNLKQNATNIEIITKIIKNLETEQRLSTLAMYYIYLRKLTKQNFKTFDSKPVYDWYNKNYK